MEHVSVCGVWRGDTVCVVCEGGTLCVWCVVHYTTYTNSNSLLLSLPPLPPFLVPPSSGVNMYAMLTGCLPYTVEPFNITTLHAKMLENKMNPIPDHLSASESTLRPTHQGATYTSTLGMSANPLPSSSQIARTCCITC